MFSNKLGNMIEIEINRNDRNVGNNGYWIYIYILGKYRNMSHNCWATHWLAAQLVMAIEQVHVLSVPSRMKNKLVVICKDDFTAHMLLSCILIFVYMPKYVMMSKKKVIVAIPYESHVTWPWHCIGWCSCALCPVGISWHLLIQQFPPFLEWLG